MRGVIATTDELNMCLEHKPLHQALLGAGFNPVNHSHTGRNLYVTYASVSKVDCKSESYQIVQWLWDTDEGWKPFLRMR